MHSSYDDIATMYDRHWRDWYLPAALPALERLFFASVPRDSAVLDVCCGCGHVTAELVRRGYRVTGVDLSSELIGIAKRNVHSAQFLAADVRQLRLPRRFDAALSTFDALNHMLSLEDLRQAIRAVHGCLRPGGLFVFDMNLEEAYHLDLSNWNATVEDDSVSLVRGSFDPVSKLARTQLVWFRRDGRRCWDRRSSTIEEKCYPEAEILDALGEAGFRESASFAPGDLGVTSEIGYGRRYFRARA